MQEYLLNPITLICLGTIFILVSLLFLYFKRHLSFLEKAQMDQSRILQSFITNTEMTSMMQRGSGVGPGPGPELNIPHQMSEQYNDTQEELIDVSDDESSSDEETDSDDESVSQEPEVIELSEQPEEISYTNIKVIQLENDNLEEVTHLKIDKLNDDESDDDDSDDDDSDDDESDDDDLCDDTEMFIETRLENSRMQYHKIEASLNNEEWKTLRDNLENKIGEMVKDKSTNNRIVCIVDRGKSKQYDNT